MPNDPDTAAQVATRLDRHLCDHARLADRLRRQFLMALHKRGIATFDSIHDDAQVLTGGAAPTRIDDPNQAELDRWDEQQERNVDRVIRDLIQQHFTVAELDDLVNLTLKKEEVESLESVANQINVSFRELADKVRKFCELPPGETKLAPSEVVGTRVALVRHFVSDQLEFIGVAKNYLEIRDFQDITERIVGSDSGMGRIGGKAGGMILAHHILAPKNKGDAAFLPVTIPESYFLRSDVIEEFIELNRLDEYRVQKYKPIEDVTREYPLIRGVFRNGDFPLKIVHSLRRILDRLGTHPLIVRSSSLLEDRFGTAFSGKYASIFLANQGPLEQRLRALLGAIAEVYASIFGPDPITYRREHNLIDYVEAMAVLIQKVVGVRCGDYYFPLFAGVAFSRNEFRWSPRLKREDGLGRLVMGLGTRAVDRAGSEFPRMVALGAPTLRPESTTEDIMRRAQRTLDVVDIKRNRLVGVRLRDLLEAGHDLPMLDKLVSIHRDGELYSPLGERVDADPADVYITFDKLLRDTPFAAYVRDLLARLEDAYKRPIDIEFACDGKQFYVLQCRPLAHHAEATEPVTVPTDIPAADVIFDAHQYVRTGLVEGIEYIVYVDPAVYDAVPSRQRRIEIARVIGRINHKLERRSFILVGPGRWGSNDLRLGVPVTYADISRARMLIEVARQKDGFLPEVSFGTHFFQDLVEADIHYLPLYPDDKGNRFNEAFLMQTPNALPRIVPADAEFADEIRLIHVPAVAQDRRLTVAMDGETDQALAYLE